MATETAQNYNEDSILKEEKEHHKTFQERLSDMPAYTMTLSQLQLLYTTLKERNEVLKNAFNTGEEYVEKITTAAKPVVWAATQSALQVAKPVVGEITDPVGKLDSAASEALAKVQEKIPIVKQTPKEIAESAKASAKETADYYLGKAKSSSAVQQTTKQLDNVVSFSELMVEICFPTDGSNPEDIKELEKAEEDEDKGIIVRAGNLKNKAIRRGTKKIMTYKPVQTTVDKVHYAQQQISEMTEKILLGTNYVAARTCEAKDVITKNYPEIKNTVEGKLSEGSQLLAQKWDHVYQTTMYIPKKAIQVTGEVYISAQEIVFAYGKAHSVTEMPHAVVEMAEKYYNSLKKDVTAEKLEALREKAFAFVFVPAQVVSEYLQSSRLVQWIVPKTVETNAIQLIDVVPEEQETQDTHM